MKAEELIKRRLEGHADPFHLALSVEGGVMRGSVSAGMIEALHARGLEKIFDSFWGTSIGALNAAYLASGETAGKSELYAQAADHLFRKRPHPVHGLIDLDWLFCVGFSKLQPLAFEKVDRERFRFLVTKAGWGRADEAVLRYQPKDSSSLRQLLQGACRAPILAGLPLGELRGGLWDAALFESWPMSTALEKEVTHLLVLRSSDGQRSSSLVTRSLLRSASFFFQTPPYETQERALEKLINKGQALEIRPRIQYVDIFERDPEKIIQGIEEGKRSFVLFWEKHFND